MSNHRYRANSDQDDQTAREQEFSQNHGLLGDEYVPKRAYVQSPQRNIFNDLYQNQSALSTEGAQADFGTNGNLTTQILQENKPMKSPRSQSVLIGDKEKIYQEPSHNDKIKRKIHQIYASYNNTLKSIDSSRGSIKSPKMLNVVLNLEKAKNHSYAKLDSARLHHYRNNETLTLEGYLAQSKASGLFDTDRRSRNDGQRQQ